MSGRDLLAQASAEVLREDAAWMRKMADEVSGGTRAHRHNLIHQYRRLAALAEACAALEALPSFSLERIHRREGVCLISYSEPRTICRDGKSAFAALASLLPPTETPE